MYTAIILNQILTLVLFIYMYNTLTTFNDDSS